MTLAQGDTVDFIVGRGEDDSDWGSFLKIRATLTLAPSPQNPGTLQFSAADYSVGENGGPVRIWVTRSGGSAGAASVHYATVANGSATPMADYLTTSGILNWDDEDTADKFFDVFIGNEGATEGNETFTVNLSAPSGAALGSPSSATVTIIDVPPSPGTIQFGQVSYSVNEAGPSVTLIVSRTGGSAGTASVNYTTANGSALAGFDYTATSSTVSWNSGESGTKTFTVPIVNDTASEGTESFTVTLTGASGAALGSLTSARVTILDNDSAPNSGPIAHWQAEGNANDSAGGNHGALMNGASFAPGKLGQGFALNGVNQYVRVPHSASLQLAGEFTVELWFKRTGPAAGGFIDQGLIDKRNWTSCNFGLYMSSDWGLQTYYALPGYGFQIITLMPMPPVDGQFHYLAATFQQVSASQVELRTYLDGQLVGSALRNAGQTHQKASKRKR